MLAQSDSIKRRALYIYIIFGLAELEEKSIALDDEDVEYLEYQLKNNDKKIDSSSANVKESLFQMKT
jgi:hypothetical protein